MSTRSIAALAFAAGLAGGIVSQFAIGTAVHAQEPAPIPHEIRAEKFVLVDPNGAPRAALGIPAHGEWPMLEVVNKGHASSARMLPEGFFGTAKPSIVPAK